MKRRAEGNLPVEVSSFVGRKDDIRDAKALLSSSRLLTLVGPGGVGKTRLARQLGRSTERAFPEGVWFIELADLEQGQLLTAIVAQVLGVKDDGSDPLDRLIEELRDARLLLILDNCEHLADACAAFVNKLLGASNYLHVAATSRHVLGVEGEQIFPVPTLTQNIGENEPLDALELFRDRAAASDPSFRITPENRQVVVEICRRLDGVPLAIELAAARVRHFSPADIGRRLDDLDLLTSDERTRPARHRAIEAAITWSFDLCSAEERELWYRASVFVGGFTLPAAESVCSIDSENLDILAHALIRLVDKSIVIRHPGAHGLGARYRMLETVRQYGAERLAASPDRDEVRRRHRDYFAAFVARGETEYGTARELDWFGEVVQDHANIRAALDFSLSVRGEAEAALTMASSLRPYWLYYGLMLEGHGWLSAALEKEPSSASTASRLRALATVADLAALTAEIDTAIAHLDEYQRTSTATGSVESRGLALLAQAFVSYAHGDHAAAVSLAEEGADEALHSNDFGVGIEATASAAVLAFFTDNRDAEELARRLKSLTEAQGSRYFDAAAFWLLGLNSWRRGQYESATKALRQGISVSETSQPGPIACCLEGLAWSAASTGSDTRAAQLLGAARSLWTYSQMRLVEAMIAQWRSDIEQQLVEVLGPAEFARQVEAGAAMSFEEAVELALGDGAGRRTVKSGSLASRGVLTKREREIADLVADGLTNKEIADKLVISPRTAESHVEHILTKMGFRSRAQIAAWLSSNEEARDT